jgi:uncharacterized protein
MGRLRLALAAVAALSLAACRDGAEANQAAPADLAAPQFPELTGRVVDNADLLSPADEQALSAKSEALEREIGPQFVIVTVPSLGGLPIERYGVQLGRRWGIGSKERDDGLMLIVAPSERMTRIEVGYGLETRVTDPFAAKVVREQLVPRFGQGDFRGGIVAGSDALIARLRSKASDEAIAKEDMVVQ